MLLLLRYASIILAILLMLSLIFALSVVIKNSIEARLNRKQKKSKAGELPTDAGVRDLILEERIDEAVDLYQRFTGVDQFTAQQVVEDMARELRLSTFRADLKLILKEHGKAAAIEAYQAGTGSNLEEALNFVEEVERS